MKSKQPLNRSPWTDAAEDHGQRLELRWTGGLRTPLHSPDPFYADNAAGLALYFLERQAFYGAERIAILWGLPEPRLKDLLQNFPSYKPGTQWVLRSLAEPTLLVMRQEERRPYRSNEVLERLRRELRTALITHSYAQLADCFGVSSGSMRTAARSMGFEIKMRCAGRKRVRNKFLDRVADLLPREAHGITAPQSPPKANLTPDRLGEKRGRPPLRRTCTPASAIPVHDTLWSGVRPGPVAEFQSPDPRFESSAIGFIAYMRERYLFVPTTVMARRWKVCHDTLVRYRQRNQLPMFGKLKLLEPHVDRLIAEQKGSRRSYIAEGLRAEIAEQMRAVDSTHTTAEISRLFEVPPGRLSAVYKGLGLSRSRQYRGVELRRAASASFFNSRPGHSIDQLALELRSGREFIRARLSELGEQGLLTPGIR